MLEKDIEQDVCIYARNKYGAMAYKFSSPNRMNVPDRIFIFPNGRVIFIEFKATGKTPNRGQKREIDRLLERGQRVYVIDDVNAGRRVVDIAAAPVAL